jgi:hypothetical protein
MALDFVVVAEGLAAQRADSLVQVQLLYVLMLHLHVRTQLQINETFLIQQWQKLFFCNPSSAYKALIVQIKLVECGM